jgi:hypothetical protein
MPRPQHRLACALATLTVLAAPALAHGQAAPPEPTGPDFKAILLADAKVTGAVKRALQAPTAFTEPAAFGDLTADGTSDAVVLVTTPGAAGAVAAYVLSAHGTKDGTLRVIYRSQSLYRAVVRVSRGALVVLTPDYAPGDELWRPSAQLERTYVHDRRAKIFRRTASRRITRSAG